MNASLARVMLCAAVVMCIASAGLADPIIDGRVTASDGYQYTTTLGVKNPPRPPAQVYLHQDGTTKVLSIAIVLPLEYVDNTYGSTSASPPTHTHPSWGTKDDDHTFNELLGSDQLGIELDNDGGSPDFKDYRATIDYLALVDTTYQAQVTSDPEGMMLSAASSLQYNLNSVALLTSDSPELDSGQYDPVNSAYDNWVFEVIYEFQIDMAAIGMGDVLSPDGLTGVFAINMVELHASPNKNGADWKDQEFDEPFTPVPEPATLGLLGLGGLATLGVGRRRRRRSA